MSGTKAGGQKASKTNRKRYGEDFYQVQGAKGGKIGTTGGFYAKVECDCKTIDGTHYKRQCAGKRGGLKSRRGVTNDYRS